MIDKTVRGAVREMLAAVLGEAPFGAVVIATMALV